MECEKEGENTLLGTASEKIPRCPFLKSSICLKTCSKATLPLMASHRRIFSGTARLKFQA
jgi:hypothetical protein